MLRHGRYGVRALRVCATNRPVPMSQNNRQSPRWHLHDYRWPGGYFVTICTAGRAEVFGEVVDGEMVLSALGEIASGEWERTVAMRPEVLADAAVVMPNHVHFLFGIVDVTGADDGAGLTSDHHRRDTMHGVPTQAGERRFGEHQAKSVSPIIGAYKAHVTRQARRAGLWGDGPLWQGRFHDRVVRNPAEADRIRQYVADNPARWRQDRYHPLPPPHWRRR